MYTTRALAQSVRTVKNSYMASSPVPNAVPVPAAGATARVPYQQAARELLRENVFQATRELLGERDWGEVTMSQIASAAGMSRQTLYNEFKSRGGVAQAYVLRLVDGYLDLVETAVNAHVGDVRGGLKAAFGDFLTEAARDPMVQSAIAGTAKFDVMRLVTSEGAPLLDAASQRLTTIFVESWALLDEDPAAVLSRLLVRQAMSFISLAPRPDESPAEDLSQLLTPLIETLIRS